MTAARKSILIVEDDTFKYDRIVACLTGLSDSPSTHIPRSVQAAVKMLGDQTFDFILLDMSLPTHDLKPGGGSGTNLLSGGLEVIMELSFMKRTDNVIVITQYPEVEIEGELVPISNVHSTLRDMFEANIVAVILYRQESSEWENDLARALR
jgi:CheY-like chemotaxis protein